MLSLSLIAAVTFTGGTSARAFFWDDDEPMFVEQPQQRSRAVKTPPTRASYPKLPNAPKDLAKPEGAITVAISLAKQSLTIYDANGVFAELAISSGKKTHPTPTGIFSVIQKSKWHRSNIYSDAPMPYMQRLTWSGIALHAGALPGYAASHGCIRVPMSFANKFWNWSRMGARVIVTQDEVAPIAVSHALLPSERPQPEIPALVEAPAASRPSILLAKSLNDTPAELKLNLRPAISDADSKPIMAAPPIQLAEAGSAGRLPPVISDATATLLLPSSSLETIDLHKALDAEITAASAAKSSGSDTTAIGSLASEPPSIMPELEPAVITPPAKPGRVAVLISGKDSRLYVRRNFEPMFDLAISITQPERPLGTHVFTASTLKGNPDAFAWNVISIPNERVATLAVSRGRKAATREGATPVSSAWATETLDRLTIPEDAMRQIGEMLMNGGSIIVSDEALKSSRETGKGTDFIIPLKQS